MTSTTFPAARQPFDAITFALWGTAVMAGATSPDAAGTAIAGSRLHRVLGLPGDDAPVSVPFALAQLRSLGAASMTAALPIPGDPLGVGGPRAFTEAAVAAGQAVVVPDLQLGMVPEPTEIAGRRITVWRTWVGVQPPLAVEDIASASRAMREAVLDAAGVLAALDAPPTPGAEPRSVPSVAPPPGLDRRARELLVRGTGLLVAIRCALADPQVAASAGLDSHRRDALVPVERAARRALVAVTHPALMTRSA